MSEMARAAPAPIMAKYAGVILRIGRKHHGSDLSFVAEAFREQRANRTVNEATGQDFFFRRTALALDEAAREFAGGVHVLAVINRQREEGSSRFWLLVRAGGNQDDRLSRTYNDRPVGLFG